VDVVERVEGMVDVVADALGTLTSSHTPALAQGVADVVEAVQGAAKALLSVAGRFPLAGSIAGVLQDVFDLYRVRCSLGVCICFEWAG
jgi:hypothetical protein